MGTVAKVNNILCVNISKIDNILKANASKFDDNAFCPAVPLTPTPTPTVTATITPTPRVTPTLTPTPSQTPPECPKDCCIVQLCYSSKNCQDACLCNEPVNVYLTVCTGDPCELSVAFGIYEEDTCTNPSKSGYYSNGTICYYWDGVSTLSFNSNC
jgi:hypothetical protein